jgi:hypothetical protein
MYALSLGVERIDETLPKPVYAFLSRLNASIVGIIALAAVQLADKAIHLFSARARGSDTVRFGIFRS